VVRAAVEGVRTPPEAEIGLTVPVSPLSNTPPVGLTVRLTGENVLHKFGMAVIVGIGALTTKTSKVLVIGQGTNLGVTVIEYVIKVCVPIGIAGDIIVFGWLLPKR
jgi:hypothetical protein